jgi:hypothetical protein
MGRLQFIGSLTRQKVFDLLITALSLIYSLFTFWREKFASQQQQEELRAISKRPGWHFHSFRFVNLGWIVGRPVPHTVALSNQYPPSIDERLQIDVSHKLMRVFAANLILTKAKSVVLLSLGDIDRSKYPVEQG